MTKIRGRSRVKSNKDAKKNLNRPPIEESNSVGVTSFESMNEYQLNLMSSLSPLTAPVNQLKQRLRQKIVNQLVEGFKIPELVDGLVEFLFEIARQDPKKARLFEIYD
jgi:hypothetical protein